MKIAQIARNGNRFYRIYPGSSRYLPIARREAEEMLASGDAREVPYLPWSRPDLYEAYKVAQAAIKRAQEAV